jgi:hypothetical protein
MNYLFLLRANPDSSDRFQDWLLQDAGPRLAESADCSGLCINIAVPPPGGELYANEIREGDGYDATIDLSCPDSTAFDRLMAWFGPELDARTDANFGYETRLSRESDQPELLEGNPAPGLKVMRGFFFHEDLPEKARIRSWDSHVNLAKRIHGFARYVRYWIGEPVTRDAPRIGGATNLHFATDEDFLNQYFTVENGSALIQQDISHFIDRGLARVFTKEYRLK